MNGKPQKINIDKSGTNLGSLEEIHSYLPVDENIEIRQKKYLNNIVEQDHRLAKKIVKPMLGFNFVNSASAILAGIELHDMLREK